jgi:hypothetical protein
VDLGHVQAHELYVKMDGGRVWMALAMAVPARLWLGGVISPSRDPALITVVVRMARSAAPGPGAPGRERRRCRTRLREGARPCAEDRTAVEGGPRAGAVRIGRAGGAEPQESSRAPAQSAWS